MGEFVEKFPLHPALEQEQALLKWLETCRKVWNLGRSLLLELNDRTSINRIPDPKTGKKTAIAFPSSRYAVLGEGGVPRPVPTGWFKNELKDREGKDLPPVWGEHCWILPKGRKGGTVDRQTGEATHAHTPNLIRVGQVCPLPIAPWIEPRLGLQIAGKYSLQYYFTQQNVRSRHEYLADEFDQVPAWFIRGVCDSLWQTWSKFRSGKGGEPSFKHFGDEPTTLTYGDAAKLFLSRLEEDGKLHPKDGAIAIPKLGVKKGKPAPAFLRVQDLFKRWSVEEEFRLPSVARLVRLPQGNWQLHLTGYEPTQGDIWNLLRWAQVESAIALGPHARLHLLTASPWALKRRQDCTLTVPGEDHVVAIDDRGYGYSVLPRRPSDGVLDPHHLIPRLDRQIEELQQAISWKIECSKRHDSPSRSNRLAALKQQKRKLEWRRTMILRSSRQKIAHFISERSRSLTIYTKPAQRIRKPRARLKAGAIDPAEFEPNSAARVAEKNRSATTAAPGEFVALLKRFAGDRAQPIKVITVEKVKKTKKRR